ALDASSADGGGNRVCFAGWYGMQCMGTKSSATGGQFRVRCDDAADGCRERHAATGVASDSIGNRRSQRSTERLSLARRLLAQAAGHRYGRYVGQRPCRVQHILRHFVSREGIAARRYLLLEGDG